MSDSARTPEALRARRKALGLTQRGLAERLGKEGPRIERTVEDWEAGRRQVPDMAWAFLGVLEDQEASR